MVLVSSVRLATPEREKGNSVNDLTIEVKDRLPCPYCKAPPKRKLKEDGKLFVEHPLKNRGSCGTRGLRYKCVNRHCGRTLFKQPAPRVRTQEVTF